MNPTILVVCLVFLLSCCSCNQRQDNEESFITIDIESNVRNMEELYLSKYADDIRYVPLETKEGIFLENIRDFDISNGLIVTADLSSVVVFDSGGHFIRKFGTKGRGPEEYQFIQNLSFAKDNKIYFQSLYDLLEFNVDGSFLKKYKNTFLIKNNYYLASWHIIDDSLFFGHVPNSTGNMEYKAMIVDRNSNIIHSYKNFILFHREHKVASTLEDHAMFPQFHNNFFYKDAYNDTLFKLTDDYQLIPKYAFNLGKYKQTITERNKLPPNFFQYIFLNGIFQTEKYLFIDCSYFNHFPAKRITQKKPPAFITDAQFIKDYGWYNTRSMLGIYDKSSGNLIFSKPTSTDNPLYTSGLYNDLDAGPRFLPIKMINDSTMVMFVKAKDLKDHVESEDFKNSNAKYPVRKKQLENLANRLTIMDNPVLMMAVFKN